MTEKALVCAICACDRFFLICKGESCDLVCTGCGVRSEIRVETEARGQLVEAP